MTCTHLTPDDVEEDRAFWDEVEWVELATRAPTWNDADAEERVMWRTTQYVNPVTGRYDEPPAGAYAWDHLPPQERDTLEFLLRASTKDG